MPAAIAISMHEGVELGHLWRQLLTGELFVAETWCEQERCFATLDHGRLDHAVPQSYGARALQRVFCGEPQKCLAWESGLSVSSVSNYCAATLRKMANESLVSRASILLVMAAHAANGLTLEAARIHPAPGTDCWRISVAVPGATFRDRLSPSEREVTRMSIEGRGQAEISRTRGTSVRTTANQVASIFHKLKVSGRAELRSKAVQEHALASQLTPRASIEIAPRLSIARPDRDPARISAVQTIQLGAMRV